MVLDTSNIYKVAQIVNISIYDPQTAQIVFCFFYYLLPLLYPCVLIKEQILNNWFNLKIPIFLFLIIENIMENSYAKSLAKNKNKNQNTVSISNKPLFRLNTYKYSLIKLPLINKDSLNKQKSSSNYSTQASKRKKLENAQKQNQQTRGKQRKEISPRNFATDRDRSKSKNSPVKQQQQQLIMSYQSNQTQSKKSTSKNQRNIYNRAAAKSTDDNNIGSLEWSVNTVDTQSLVTKKSKMVEFQNIGFKINQARRDLGQSSSLKTTDILDNFQSHVKRYGTEHIKLIPLSKTKPKQLEIGKELERVKLMQRQTETSIEKYIQYKKYQIEQVLNQKIMNSLGHNRLKTRNNYY